MIRLQLDLMQVILFAVAMSLMADVLALPTVRCRVTQAGETQTIDTRPAAMPYEFMAHDIRGHFRFKPVVVGDAGYVDYIKLYTYYQSAEQPVLMHVAKFARPGLPRGTEIIPLSGVVQLISPRLGRELEYACTLIEAGP